MKVGIMKASALCSLLMSIAHAQEANRNNTPILGKASTILVKKTSEDKKEPEAARKSITVTNKITNDMVTYKGNRAPWPIVPTIFKLLVNDKEIKQNDTTKVDITDNTLKVLYEWEFKKMCVVHHREYRAVEFAISTTTQDFNIQFSWDDDFRLLVNNAQPVQSVNLDMNRKKK